MPDRKDPEDLVLKPGSSALGGVFANVLGQADSRARAPGRPDFSGVRAHSDSVPGRPAARPRTYTVRDGDTLSAIAQRHYGRASGWPQIFAANRDQLDDPDRILPGQVLRLPQLDD